jgi:hypothetical protein
VSDLLRLLAEDGDDLEVISAALQDAVTRIGDIQFSQRTRTVTVALNRFRWEADGRRGERIRAGLQLGGVMGVKARKLRRDAKAAVLELLAVSFAPGEAPGGVITLTFAGGGDLAVEVECVDVALADVSQPWPTPRKPGHES